MILSPLTAEKLQNFFGVFLQFQIGVDKASSKTIQLKPIDGDGKVITRKPRKAYNGSWCFSIDDAYTNTFYKPAKVSEAG